MQNFSLIGSAVLLKMFFEGEKVLVFYYIYNQPPSASVGAFELIDLGFFSNLFFAHMNSLKRFEHRAQPRFARLLRRFCPSKFFSLPEHFFTRAFFARASLPGHFFARTFFARPSLPEHFCPSIIARAFFCPSIVCPSIIVRAFFCPDYFFARASVPEHFLP